MAEAVQLPSLETRYFCYQCDRQISLPPSDQLICPECSTGFLEEVSEDTYSPDEFDGDSVDESDLDESELNMVNLLSLENLFRRSMLSTLGENRSFAHVVTDDGDGPAPRPAMDMLSSHNLLQELEDSFMRGNNTTLQHIGDYLFNSDIDALSTMLLNETETVGPPPLPKDQIKLLPVHTISQEEVGKEVQCTICMEDFAIREKAKTLPCDHFYHETCITPWLERHSTCPNCRKPVETQSKCQRSQSCPRSELNLRSSDQRRSSESASVSGFLRSRNPFNFM